MLIWRWTYKIEQKLLIEDLNAIDKRKLLILARALLKWNQVMMILLKYKEN